VDCKCVFAHCRPRVSGVGWQSGQKWDER
jgi:hypothetical protein